MQRYGGCRGWAVSGLRSMQEVARIAIAQYDIAAGVMDNVAVRDVGLLAAAAGRPRVTVFGDDAYPSFPDKAAALLHSPARRA